MSTGTITFQERSGRIESAIPGVYRLHMQKYARTSLSSVLYAQGSTKLLQESTTDRTVRIKNAQIWFDEVSESITEENSAMECNCVIRIYNGSTPLIITASNTAMVANNVIIAKFPEIEYFTLPASYYLELLVRVEPLKSGALPTTSDHFITNFTCELEYPL